MTDTAGERVGRPAEAATTDRTEAHARPTRPRVPASTSEPASAVPDELDPADVGLLWDEIRPLVGLAAGANIVMQLARLGVGRGVAESTVESGRLDRHPLKRARTTFGYVVLSLFGTPQERAWLRAEVNRSHRPVRSAPDDAVQYRAMDPDLQRWVALCIAKGLLDAFDLRHLGHLRWDPRTGGPRTSDPDLALAPHLRHRRDRLVQLTSRIGTTLQMPAAAWPADTASFEAAFAQGVEVIAFDEVTTSYLRDFLRLRWLGPLGPLLGPSHQFLSTGFLAPAFRDGLGLAWSDRHQRRWESVVALARLADRVTPAPVAHLYPRVMLTDARRRFRKGKDFT